MADDAVGKFCKVFMAVTAALQPVPACLHARRSASPLVTALYQAGLWSGSCTAPARLPQAPTPTPAPPRACCVLQPILRWPLLLPAPIGLPPHCPCSCSAAAPGAVPGVVACNGALANARAATQPAGPACVLAPPLPGFAPHLQGRVQTWLVNSGSTYSESRGG
jgi:hypothetical protein